MTLTFGSLFAGIGGFDLGFERAGMKCVFQVEIDPFCRLVLAKHWPDVRRHDDVRTFPDGDPKAWKVDVICGGFPCQDISLAGERSGLAGERSGLWWEFARIVRLLRPRFVVVENVPGLLSPVDDGEQAPIGCVLGELARGGYDAEWACVPASAFGSTQQRFRVFIIAHAEGHGNGFRVLPARWRPEGEGAGDAARDAERVDANADLTGCEELHISAVAEGSGFDHRHVSADAVNVGVRKRAGRARRTDALHEVRETAGKNHAIPQRGKRRQGAEEDGVESGERRAPSEPDRRDSPFVGSGWWGSEPEVVRMVYGVPRRLVRPAIHALGNSVIPQVAEWIGRRLMEAHRRVEESDAP